MRQPMASPSRRPRGIPNTIANDVPVASNPRACTCLPSGARRTARDAVIDQNNAWDKAMPIRLTISKPKLLATLERIWLSDKHAEQHDQQFAPLDVTGQQHHRQ